MNLKLKIFNTRSSTQSMSSRLSYFLIWKKIRIPLFFIILVSFTLMGWQIWHKSLQGEGWSQQRKQEYLKAQSSGVTFKEVEFNNVINDLQKRKNENNNSKTTVKDIFKE